MTNRSTCLLCQSMPVYVLHTVFHRFCHFMLHAPAAARRTGREADHFHSCLTGTSAAATVAAACVWSRSEATSTAELSQEQSGDYSATLCRSEESLNAEARTPSSCPNLCHRLVSVAGPLCNKQAACEFLALHDYTLGLTCNCV